MVCFELVKIEKGACPHRPIRSTHKDPSLQFLSGKTLQEHIVDFKSRFIQPDCVLKLIGFLSMEKISP